MKPEIIGLTGGIGSGKTTIAGFFKSLGVPVYIADDAARKILYTHEIINKVYNLFGQDAFTGDLPDRKKIAGLVFNNTEKLAALNSIIHPEVKLHFFKWVKKHKQHKFVIKEAAILFESGSYADCDRIILVTAPIELRISRVIIRDKITVEEVEQRIANQWDEERKIELSNFIIHNINISDAEKQAKAIFQTLNQ